MAWCAAEVPVLSEGEPWLGVLLRSLFLVKERAVAWCAAEVPVLSEGEPWPGVLLGSLFLVKESRGLVCC